MSKVISVYLTYDEELIYQLWKTEFMKKYPFLPDKNSSAGAFIKMCIAYYAKESRVGE